MNINELKIDEDFKTLLPKLSDEAFEKLEEDILAHGLLSPIVTWNGYIIDGHNRYEISMKHGITDVAVKSIVLSSKADAMNWIVESQFAKRNLPLSERIRLLAKVHAEYERQAKERQAENMRNNQKQNIQKSANLHDSEPIRTATEVAKRLGVSEHTYRDAKLVVDEGTPEQIQRMDKGGKGNAVSAIAREIREEKVLGEPVKTCCTCKRILPIRKFSRNKTRRDMHATECKECHSARLNRLKALEADKTGSILRAIESVKDMTNIPVATYEDTLEIMKETTDSFVRQFNYNYKKIVFDTEEKKEEIAALIRSVEPRLGKEIG